MTTIRRFLHQHWFLLALVGVLAAGFLGWRWLADLAARRWIAHGIVFVTMFALTWPIGLQQLLRSVQRPGPALLAFAIGAGGVPLMAWPLARLLGGELGPGMIVLAAAPTTLASAAVWTRKAGGNDLVPIINTLLSNGLCFLILPGWVWLLHGRTSGEQRFASTAILLLLLIVLPMLLSQLARLHETSAAWASRQKSLLGLVAQTGILIMVLIGTVQAGERMSAAQPPTAGLLVMMAALTALLHLAAWWLGFALSGRMGMARADRIGVAYSGSQKTLMIGLTTALELGVSILPLVVYHILQLVIGTLLANWLSRPNGGAPLHGDSLEGAESLAESG